jgi:L-lactate dehydrogenase complex protein LldG
LSWTRNASEPEDSFAPIGVHSRLGEKFQKSHLMIGSRTEILGKIRMALAKPRREHHHGHQPVTSNLEELFASVSSRDSMIEKFRREFEAVSGEFAHCPDETAVVQTIKDLITSSGSTRIAISRHSICERLNLEQKFSSELPDVQFMTETLESENPFERARLREATAQVQLSITGAEYLLVESGTIVVVAGRQASRQISLLPSIHLVLTTSDQIYPNMADLFLDIQKKYGTDLPGSALTFITGPSRTADIEKVLIKGVHGPMRLLAIIIGE